VISGFDIYDGTSKLTATPLDPAATTYTIEDAVPGEHLYTVQIL
jgi:hypothetical protein